MFNHNHDCRQMCNPHVFVVSTKEMLDVGFPDESCSVKKRGPPGPQGPRGNDGATGAMGATGMDGNTGPAGMGGPGSTGQTGIPGSTGQTGIQGSTGMTGGVGMTGMTGGVGMTGMTGGVGMTGMTGGVGMTGQTGGVGGTGQTGQTGGVGGTGQTGGIGGTGPTGAGQTGPTGPTGNAGSAGPTGPSGSLSGLTAGVVPVAATSTSIENSTSYAGNITLDTNGADTISIGNSSANAINIGNQSAIATFNASTIWSSGSSTTQEPAYSGLIGLSGGYPSPVAGRLLFGDGTGWNIFFSRRQSSVTTDLISFTDGGNMDFLTNNAFLFGTGAFNIGATGPVGITGSPVSINGTIIGASGFSMQYIATSAVSIGPTGGSWLSTTSSTNWTATHSGSPGYNDGSFSAGVWTVPITGHYHIDVNFSLIPTATLTAASNLGLFIIDNVSGNTWRSSVIAANLPSTSSFPLIYNGTIPLTAGDTITLEILSECSAAVTFNSSNCLWSVYRVT